MTADARLDLRLPQAEKERIQRAARQSGLPLATFVRHAALREADRITAGQPAGTVEPEPSLSARLLGRATVHMSTEEIMRLTRGT